MLCYRRTVGKWLFFFSSLIVFALPCLSLQTKFGTKGTDDTFRLFQSDSGKNLLFKDSTKCLQEVPAGDSFEKFLKEEYMTAMSSLRTCTDSTPGSYRGGFSPSSDSRLPAYYRNNTCYCSPQIWRKPARSIPANRKTSGDQSTRGLLQPPRIPSQHFLHFCQNLL